MLLYCKIVLSGQEIAPNTDGSLPKKLISCPAYEDYSVALVVVLTYAPLFVASTQKGELFCHRDQSCKFFFVFLFFFPKVTFCQSLDKILILSSFLFATMLHGQLERSQFS